MLRLKLIHVHNNDPALKTKCNHLWYMEHGANHNEFSILTGKCHISEDRAQHWKRRETFTKTHWGLVTLMRQWTRSSIGPGNGLLRVHQQASTRINAALLAIEPLGNKHPQEKFDLLSRKLIWKVISTKPSKSLRCEATWPCTQYLLGAQIYESAKQSNELSLA